LDLRGVA